MKKINIFKGNIVMNGYELQCKPITFLIGDVSIPKVKQIVKEDAILYYKDDNYINIDEITDSFDLFAEKTMRNGMKVDYFNYLKEEPTEKNNFYVDKNTIQPYFSAEESNENISVKKFKKSLIQNK